jgi:hypothetical protein
MHQTRLIQFLKLFSPEENKRFASFLQSPYYNTSDKMIQFFGILEPHHPDYDSPKLEKEKVYARMYGKGKYNDQTMRDLSSDMLRLAKLFAATEQFQKDEPETALHRYTWLREKNAVKFRQQENEQRGKMIEKMKLRDLNYYRHRWLHDYHQFEQTAARYVGAEHKLLEGFDITAHIRSLSRYYVLSFFETYIYLPALAKIYNRPEDEKLINHIFEIAKDYLGKGDAAIDLYYNCYQLLRTDDEKYYFELKDALFENSDTISPTLKLELAINLENYGMAKIRQGEKHFGYQVIQIFRFEVENGLCMKDGEIDKALYQNIAGIGVETNELDWVENFVEEYKKYLSPDYREEVYSYAKAHVLFARKDFNKALVQALSSHTAYFFWNKILTRNVVARSQYELGMFDQVLKELETLKHDMRDEKINDVRRENTFAFIDGLQQLVDLNFNFSRAKANKLKQFIETEKRLFYKKWFLEKVAALEQPKRAV